METFMSNSNEETKADLDRRGFIKSATALGLAAASTPFLNMLCVKNVFAAESKCRVMMSPTLKITPPYSSGGSVQNVFSMIYDTIVRLEGADQKLTLCLAESYETNADKSQWTFKLKENVKFHHGTAMTAEDIIFTVERWQNPALGGPMCAASAGIEKVVSDGKFKVIFNLKQPDPNFLYKLLEYNAAILAHDYDYEKNGNTKPSGTGAFKVTTLVPGQRIVMVKNSDYFIPGLPKVDNMEVIFVSESQTQLLALEAGQVDIVRWVGFDSALRYKNHPKINLYTVNCSNHPNFYMGCDKPPFNDVRVRQAVKHCVNRKNMLGAAAYGYGNIGNDSPVWPESDLYTDIGFPEYSIEKAKKLLAEAGYEKGFDVDCYVPSNHPPLLDVALTMQQMLKPAGINLQIQGVTRDIYYARYWLKVNCGITNWAHRENPIDLMNLSLRTGAAWNESKFDSPELNALLDQASVEADEKKAKKIIAKIEKLLMEQGPSVVPFFYPVFTATGKNVKNYYPMRNMSNDYRYIEMA